MIGRCLVPTLEFTDPCAIALRAPWLPKQGTGAAALADQATLRRVEESLAKGGSDPMRVWWVAANPKEWSWSRFATEASVDYRFGRIQRMNRTGFRGGIADWIPAALPVAWR